MESLTIINRYGITHTIPADLLPQVVAAGGQLVAEEKPAPVTEDKPAPAKRTTRRKTA